MSMEGVSPMDADSKDVCGDSPEWRRRGERQETRIRGYRVGEGGGVVSEYGVGGAVERRVGREPIASESCSPALEASDASEDHNNWIHGFEIGDMVWGKVKSHPWWPGHIFNEAFASPSVRRTRREGHILVAFFGDSSYGWFDPAELVPFDSHFAEKSKQTNSRNFLKAVEEAVDEVSRRRSLGLSCCCRSPFSFRPASVPGYSVVDVIGYESSLVYSDKQIKKARDSFSPSNVISFLNHIAVMPCGVEHGSIGLTKTMSMLLALRKATYEEFDETYAQAFGVEPVRPSRDAQGVLEQPLNVAPRAAPLSGRLVIAETLGKKKGASSSISSKSTAKIPKDQEKKNKYLFKRRDDAPPTVASPFAAPNAISPKLSSPAAHGVSQGQGNLQCIDLSQAQVPSVLSPPQAPQAAAIPTETGHYVLQRRSPPTDAGKREDGSEFAFSPGEGFTSFEPSSSDFPETPTRSISVPEVHVEEAVDVVARRKGLRSGEVGQRQVKPDDESLGFVEDDKKSVVQTASDLGGKRGPIEPVPVTPVDLANVDDNKDITLGVAPMAVDVELQARKPRDATVSGVVVKKEMKQARQDAGLGSAPPPPDSGEKKKKRKKRDTDEMSGLEHPIPKQPKIGKSVAGRSIGIRPVVSAEVKAGQQGKDSGNERSGVSSVLTALSLPKLELSPRDLNFPLLVTDLSALALDPFHGNERNASLIVRHVFLRFRSLVYQKSLQLPSPIEPDPSEVRDRKTEVAAAQQGAGAVQIATLEVKGREQKQPLSNTKPVKHVAKTVGRPEDPAKAGRKRPPSDRQEELSAKRVKKLSQLKTLASEKKAGSVTQKAPDAQTQEKVKDGGAKVAPVKTTKVDAPKKQEPVPLPPKIPTPTYLVMKFPQRTTLPSIASLKARFGRFGALDLSGARVYWKSYTCKVLFKYRADAQTAYNYAMNNDVFGRIKVIYTLRDDVPTSDPVEEDKRPSDSRADAGVQQFRPGRGGEPASHARLPFPSLKQPQQSVQLKSILKKEPAPGATNVVRESPRVKFMLEGEDNSRREPSVVVSNGGLGNGLLPSPLPPPENNKNGRFATSSPLPPLLPLPVPRAPEVHHRPRMLQPPQPPLAPIPVAQERGPQFSRPRPLQGKYNQGREMSNVDISSKMLSLLRRCNDIVNNVQSTLGYVPYHPL